jgi:AraC-like DNA-binding protein
MSDFSDFDQTLSEPQDYFQGLGTWSSLPTPRNMLMFVRTSKSALQQNALRHPSHHRFVLLVNAETAGMVHVDHHQVPLRPGESMLIHPFQFHHYSHLRVSKLRWIFCTFELPDDAWARGMPKGAVPLTQDCRKAFAELCALWPEAAGNPESASELCQVKLLELLMWFRKSDRSRRVGLLPDQGATIIAAVNRMMAGASAAQMRVEALAEGLGLSASHVRLRFRKASGVSLGRYLENYRLNRAMGLLVNTRDAVGDIALQAGYASPQAFHRAFRRLTDETPLAYRQRRGCVPGLT